MITTKLPRPLLYLLLTVAVFLAIVIISLGSMAFAYHAKYYPGVKVAGIDLTGKSYQEGKDLIDGRVKQYEEHQVVLRVPNIAEPATNGVYPDKEIKTTASSLGLTFKEEETVQGAWNVGHYWNVWQWLKSSMSSLFVGHAAALPYVVEENQVTTFINTQVVPQIVTPTPAKMLVDKDRVYITDPKPGLSVDQTKLAKELADSLSSATDADVTYLKAPSQIVDSPITKAFLQPLADQLDRLGNLQVSLTSDKLNLVPNRADILAWFIAVQDGQGNLSMVISKESLTSYLNAHNSSNTIKVAESVEAIVQGMSTATNATIPVDKQPKSYSVALAMKPVAAVTPGSYDLNLADGKYVQVDLSDQKLYLINNHVLEKTYVISSGYWTTPTPLGKFHIISKSPRAYSSEFGLYMPWWENFVDDEGKLGKGEFGLHELPEWPNGYKEGENHLGTPVSHGCVRLGVGDAKEVYDWTDIGTYVFINE